MSVEAAVEVRNVSKIYPRVVANKNVSLQVKSGEIHAIVGENGAGKSTLMKIIYGMVAPDSGEIAIFGKTYKGFNTAHAIASGVGMVHQHFMLVPPLTVAENVILGIEPTRGVFIDLNAARELVKKFSAELGMKIDPDAKVEACPVGIQQRIEIVKVLARGAKIIILDEPTAVLIPQEVEELLRTLKRLAFSGKTIILITHKLDEVMKVADRVTVMRQGEVVATKVVSETNVEELARMMIGRELQKPVRSEFSPGEVILKVEGLSCLSEHSAAGLENVSFEIHAGEILGIAGIEGNGQSELIECICGLRKPSGGRITIAGVDVTTFNPRKRFDLGLAHIPEDRHKRAVVLDFSVYENSIFGMHHRKEFSGPFWMKRSAVKRFAEEIVRLFDVRPAAIENPFRALSGGNQQKVVVGRELARKPKLLIAAQPTRGVDIGAIETIHRAILEAKRQKCAVLLVSAELPEIMSLSDRIAVMYEGKIVGFTTPAEVDESKLGLMMIGQK